MTRTSTSFFSSTPPKTGKLIVSGLILGAGLGLSAGVAAGERTDQRGYDRCVGAMDTSNLSGVTFPRQYYISRQADSKAYYLNAHAWEDGVRVAKRLRCETSKNGRVLLSVESGDGQYARSEGVTLNVAKR